MTWEAPVAAGPIAATISVPGSKSASARALVLSCLAESPTVLTGLLVARDTQLMQAAIETLGCSIERTGRDSVVVRPPGHLVAGGTIDCGLSGTVMRFVPPLAGLADGSTAFIGDAEAARRPVAPLLRALASLGIAVDRPGLPFSVEGPPTRGGEVTLDASSSSQFVSALLLTGCRFPGGLTVRHRGAAMPSHPHVDMTIAMLAERGIQVETPEPWTWVVPEGTIAGGSVRIEPDLTNTATLAAAALVTGGRLRAPWPRTSVQASAQLLRVLEAFGAVVVPDGDWLEISGERGLRGAEVDLHEVSELTCVATALAALAEGPSRIGGVGHIRGHETDRLAALHRELTDLGGSVIETTDGLEVEPTRLTGGTFHTYADHRMAHAGALLGLVVPGVVLDDVGCTSKTLPDFVGLWSELLGRIE